MTRCSSADIFEAMGCRHLFICVNSRASGKPACGLRGGEQLLAEVTRLLVRAPGEAIGDAIVTPTGCLGPCFDGPNAVIYGDRAEGDWYGDLEPADAAGLVEHLLTGTRLGAKSSRRPGLADLPDLVGGDGGER